MINESVLLESRTLRTSVLERTHVLDKVKTLSLLPDGLHVTTAMVAAYFEVAEKVINRLRLRHREELTGNGMRTLKGADLESFESDNLSLSKESYPQGRGGRVHLAVYTRRTILNVAMLLRDSEVARNVRIYLLDSEQSSRPQPVPNDIESLDERITSPSCWARPSSRCSMRSSTPPASSVRNSSASAMTWSRSSSASSSTTSSSASSSAARTYGPSPGSSAPSTP
ncbi:hypothetical protein OHA89_19190 [Streptomyces sp. NBC_01546]